MVEKDINVGMTFGYLKVVAPKQQSKKRESWLCECTCGNTIIKGRSLLLGTKKRRPDKSCGCKENKFGGDSVKHHRIYQIWHSMIGRCYDDRYDNYERYGEKGVTVCKEWRNNFQAFLDWALVNGYKENLTLDRIDSEESYHPSNCRWVDYYTQSQNKVGANKNSKTGVRGVVQYKYGYRAYITNKGKRHNLGTFKTLEDATIARKEGEEKYWNQNN